MAETRVTKAEFGKMPGGEQVDVYLLKSSQIEARIITFGARLISVKSPDRTGKMEDVVIGYDTMDKWLADKNYLGAIVGRYGNRIAKGRFTLDGKEFQIPANNNGNALHGGPVGFDQKVWAATPVANGVQLTLVSEDGDMGFPGTLHVKVTYQLIDGDLTIQYEETTDKPTVVALTNHAYFNLSGDDKQNVLAHKMTIFADGFTPADKELIPTGEIRPVDGLPLDFRTARVIGDRIDDQDEQLVNGGGYDHNWVLSRTAGAMKTAAKLEEPASGRTLTVSTTEPGVQFYSGNFLDGALVGRHNVSYTKHMGLCLETQHFPDSPNQSSFPSTVVRPGEVRTSTTVLAFGVQA